MTTTSSTDWATSARTWLETSTARPSAACSRSSPRSQVMPGRVQAVGRLVEDQHLRVAEQRGGDGQALAHPHRVALHAPVGGVVEPDGGEDLVDPAGGMPAGGGQDPQVVAGAAARMERGVLEHGADAGGGLLELVVALPVERRRSRRRPHEAEQRAQRRALAGAVGAEEAGHAAGLDVEGEVVDGGDAAEALGEVADLDGGHGSGLRSGVDDGV